MEELRGLNLATVFSCRYVDTQMYGRFTPFTKIHQAMKIIFLLILVSLIIALGFLMAFFWAVRSGQYEDDYTPSIRILLDKPADNNDKQKT